MEVKGREGKTIRIILKINALVTDWLHLEDLSCRTRGGGFSFDGGRLRRHEGVFVVVFVG